MTPLTQDADERALLAAIDADPDDDAVRLVYADRLEERGDSRAAGVRRRVAQMARIREKFARLKSADANLSVWAAHSHGYELQPPLKPAEVRELEARYGVRFPDDYADFVVRFAESGAGPSYGIESVRKRCHESISDPFPLEDTAGDVEHGYDTEETVGGVLLLAEHGCASDAFLVVTGKEAGKVWEIWGGGDGLWHATGMGFLDWYEAWLDQGLREVRAG